MKRRKRPSDTVVTTIPAAKSRLLEKTSTSPKSSSVSASACTSYDFDDAMIHQPIVPRVTELEVIDDMSVILYCAVSTITD